MKINAGTGFNRLAGFVDKLVGDDVGLSHGLSSCEVDIGSASDPRFGVPAHADASAIFMGDSSLIEGKDITAACEAMLKSDPDKVQIRPVFNPLTGKFKQKFAMAGDADFDPIAGQLFSPWNVTFLSKIWKEPLAYSRAKQIIRTEHAGSNPFAEIFTLFMEQYAGWGSIGTTGDLQNQLQNDVNVKDGMASFPIINMMGTYSLTLEEKRRKTWGPTGNSPLARKQSYLNYVFDMMDAILIYFGNKETNTLGLLDVNPQIVWDGAKSLKAIANDTTIVNKGSKVYQMLAGLINDFLTKSDNKFQHIKIAVSPEAYNLLTSMPYSDTYSAESALSTFGKNYLAGKGPNGTDPMIEFIAEPLLKANSLVNPNPYDIMVINCPEVGGGVNNEAQATNFYATVLNKFVFPVIPGMYNDQYKTLRRVAGVVAPIPSATQAYLGFGVQ